MNLERVQKNRIIAFMVIVIVLFLALAGRLYYLQIIKGAEYNQKAINNRIKLVKTPAPRGPIIDRNGIALADNVKAYVVDVIPDEMEKEPAALELLCDILNMNAKVYYDIIEETKPRPGYPVRIAINVTLDQIIKIGENRHILKGVSVDNTYVRSYPLKNKACHITGYTREISKEALEEAREKGLKYRPGDNIGVAGLEKFYEQELRGVDGGKRLMVNARGEVVKVLKDMPSEQGKTLKLSLDTNLQAVAMSAMSGKVGATVAIDPNNGEILAMVSNPTFDPNIFTEGLKASDWRKLSQNRGHPLQNRFIGSYYPPGSVFKPIIGISCLENGVSQTSTYAYCPGYIRLGGYKKGCWAAHGGVDFYRAISMSCDTWFYKQSMKLGIERLYKTATEFGLGQPTGIDLPEEVVRNGKAGNFPSKEWHKKVHKREWVTGDTLNVSIGQGDVLVSPLQMAVAISAVANGGTVYKPHLLKEIIDPKTGQVTKNEIVVNSRVEAKDEYFKVMQSAMEGCVRGGTGRPCAISGVRVGGKTGSAEATGGKAHGWFVAFAPVDNPKIVVATIVEHGGSGSGAAAPVCRAMIKQYLGK